MAWRPPDEEVRATAAAILERDPYAAWRRWDPDALEALARALERLLDGLEALRLESPVVYVLILVGLLATALVLLGHVLWAVRVALADGPPPEPRRAAVSARRRFEQEARDLAARDRFLEASHRLLLASIEQLVRKNLVELARHDPNRTLRARLAVAPLPVSLREEFLALLDRLEVQWFRDRVDDADLYRRWRALHERLGALPGASG